MKGVAIANPKGGVGKTVLCHLLALGAAWRGVPAYIMHTDDRPPLITSSRPYQYIDAREPTVLERVMDELLTEEGLCIIDSGGNRPEFDRWIALMSICF